MNINIFNFKDPTLFISKLLETKMKYNPNYSLRALARDLKIPISMLSSMINKKRPISYQYANKIANYLELSALEFQYFFDLITLHYSTDNDLKNSCAERIESFYSLNSLNTSTKNTYTSFPIDLDYE